MPGKKAHKPRNRDEQPQHGTATGILHQKDPKRRKGQYSAWGNPPLIKK